MTDLDQRIHKYQRGGVLVVGSNFRSEVGLGAIILASKASFASGAGIVMACLDKQLLIPAQVAMPELVVGDFTDIDRFLKNAKAIVVGPGWLASPKIKFDQNQVLLQKFLLSGKPLVIDAGAIDLVASSELFKLLTKNVILTPHDGELQRLLKYRQIDSAETLSKSTPAIIIQKGPKTTVWQNGEAKVHDLANRRLAIAGSGDVLAGLIASLAAQNQDTQIGLTDICYRAVQKHAQAGQKLENGQSVQDLITNLQNII